MTITKGLTYQELLLDISEHSNHILNYTVTKTDYGYKILKVTSFVATYRFKLIINTNGSAKATCRVEANYRRPYQYTLYFYCKGREIKGESTREEMAYYRKLQKGN